MEAECDGSEVVVRFSPFAAEKLRLNAEDTWEDDNEHGVAPPRYGVSVLAMNGPAGTSIASVIEQLTAQTQLGGKRIAVILGSKLREHGFEVVRDATGAEPHHHLVGKDPFQTIPDVEVLASLLDEGRMPNPAWPKGNPG